MYGTYYIHKITGKIWPERDLELEIEYRADSLYRNTKMRADYAKRYNVDLTDEDNDGDYYGYCIKAAEKAMMRFFREVDIIR